MWKPNKFCHSGNIKWHSSNCVDQFQFTGASQAINIDHHQGSTEVFLICIQRSTLRLNLKNNFLVIFTDDNETQIAFAKHFDSDLELYKSICIINLVEQSGKEKVIFDAYGNHVVKYNNDKLIYVTFDFHEYWCVQTIFESTIENQFIFIFLAFS